MANKLITIEEIATSLLKMAQESVDNTMPNATKEEKEKAVREILNAFGQTMMLY